MKKTNYFQPQTTIGGEFPRIMQVTDASHETGTIPTNPSTPGSSGGLGAPRKTV